MDIKWIDGICPTSPSKAHFFSELCKGSEGSIFQCKYCIQLKWLPGSYDEAIRLSQLMHRLGEDAGYSSVLSDHPEARAVILRWQEMKIMPKIRETLSAKSWAGNLHRRNITVDRDEKRTKL